MAEPTVQIINAIEVNKVTKLIKNVHPRGCTHPTLDSNLLETLLKCIYQEMLIVISLVVM